MKWTVIVTTAPRPAPTLGATVQSLERAGFNGRINVLADRHGNAWEHWRYSLAFGLSTIAPRILVCQDDVAVCQGLKAYLDPAFDHAEQYDQAELGWFSPWCPRKYARPSFGWHDMAGRAGNLCGAVCLAMPRNVAESILVNLPGGPWNGPKLGRRGSPEELAKCCIDGKIGSWAAEHDRKVWYHSPSLVDHLGNGNSTLTSPHNPGARSAADFVGLDWQHDPKQFIRWHESSYSAPAAAGQ